MIVIKILQSKHDNIKKRIKVTDKKNENEFRGVCDGEWLWTNWRE